MKKTIAAFAVLIALIASNAQAAGTTVSVTVNGMVCPFCAQGITKKFKARPEVDSIKVSLANHNVAVGLKEGQDINDETIVKILRQSGYSVEKVERKPS